MARLWFEGSRFLQHARIGYFLPQQLFNHPLGISSIKIQALSHLEKFFHSYRQALYQLRLHLTLHHG